LGSLFKQVQIPAVAGWLIGWFPAGKVVFRSRLADRAAFLSKVLGLSRLFSEKQSSGLSQFQAKLHIGK